MASSPSPKLTLLLFFLLTLQFSFQTHARDSQFFSKVSRNRDSTSSTTKNIGNEEVSTINNKNKEEEDSNEPTFLPQTSQTGFGLYGHETGLNPPSLSTPTSSPSSNYDDHMEKNNYVSELQGLSVNGFTDNNNNKPTTNKNENYKETDEGAGYYGVDDKQGITANENENYINENEGTGYYGGVQKQGMTPKYNNYYNKEDEGVGYYGGGEKQGIGSEGNKYYKEEDEGVGGYYGGDEKYGISAKNNYNYRGSQSAGYYGGVQKQGMSDTRFLENGKYFYDIEGEKEYVANPNYIHYNGNNYNSNYENNYINYEEFSNNNNNDGIPLRRHGKQVQEEEMFHFAP